MRERCHVPLAGCRYVLLLEPRRLTAGRCGLLIPSQNSFAIEVSFTPGHIAGVVSVPVELQDEKRRAGGGSGKMLDVRIGPALEICDVDEVQVGAVRSQARGLQDL